jgi:hypothetical protein
MAALGAGAMLLVAQPGLTRSAAVIAREGLCKRAASLAWSSAVGGWHGQGPGATEDGLAEAAWVATRAFFSACIFFVIDGNGGVIIT